MFHVFTWFTQGVTHVTQIVIRLWSGSIWLAHGDTFKATGWVSPEAAPGVNLVVSLRHNGLFDSGI